MCMFELTTWFYEIQNRLRRRIAELQAELTVAQGLNQTKADTTGAAVAQAAPHATSQLSDSQEHNFDRER